jgi:hypothetical protein
VSLSLANTAWTAAGAFAVAGIAHGRRRFDAEGARGPWRLLLAGCGCWLAGQLLWNVLPFAVVSGEVLNTLALHAKRQRPVEGAAVRYPVY